LLKPEGECKSETRNSKYSDLPFKKGRGLIVAQSFLVPEFLTI
jgi:hypothetical protein